MSEQPNTTAGAGSGAGCLTLMFLLFLGLKLAGVGVVASWSWWWVTAPLWIPWLIVAAVGLVILVGVGAVAAYEKVRK